MAAQWTFAGVRLGNSGGPARRGLACFCLLFPRGKSRSGSGGEAPVDKHRVWDRAGPSFVPTRPATGESALRGRSPRQKRTPGPIGPGDLLLYQITCRSTGSAGPGKPCRDGPRREPSRGRCARRAGRPLRVLIATQRFACCQAGHSLSRRKRKCSMKSSVLNITFRRI